MFGKLKSKLDEWDNILVKDKLIEAKEVIQEELSNIDPLTGLYVFECTVDFVKELVMDN